MADALLSMNEARDRFVSGNWELLTVKPMLVQVSLYKSDADVEAGGERASIHLHFAPVDSGVKEALDDIGDFWGFIDGPTGLGDALEIFSIGADEKVWAISPDPGAASP